MSRDKKMITHADLIQASTSLLADSPNPSHWFPLYDAALASDSDRELKQLVSQMLSEQLVEHRFAA
jgi:hypothetical protein